MEIRIRHDDFDFRLEPNQYIAVHEEFIKRGLVETANIQYAQFGHMGTYHQTLVAYMKLFPAWDIQLHGWQHDEYDKMSYDDIVRDLAASKWMSLRLFGSKPTTWYTPWNRRNETMERAAEFMGMTIDNESYDIAKFIREVQAGTYLGHSFYFHAWQKSELALLPEALDLCKQMKS